MLCSVFCGISVDGFMARPDGSVDFLHAGEGVPHGFEEFYATIDAVVIGRKTWEWVLGYGQWVYGKMRVVVLSSQPLDFSRFPEARIEQMSGEPAAIVAQLAATGSHHLYIDGGVTIQRFLRAGCIDRLIITRVPALIGQGIPLFGALPRDIELNHIATRTYDRGLVQSEYTVARQPANSLAP
ncbi:MAG TPA: dihydrofolate reductase family protein [Acidobacteriaceae bacterium]|jgi:dihydrofolate reductase|nr:dihydrofolate reductase family protein [Acidobacteriaceae bacterium]